MNLGGIAALGDQMPPPQPKPPPTLQLLQKGGDDPSKDKVKE